MRVWPITRIARWETTRGFGGIDRRTTVISLLIVLSLVSVTPAFLAQGTGADHGLYTVAVTQESPYADPVEATPAFAVIAPVSVEEMQPVLWIQDGEVRSHQTPKGQAALAVLRRAVASYNDRLMAEESDQAAAFPVRVTLLYQDQVTTLQPASDDGTSERRDSSTGGTGSSTGEDGSGAETGGGFGESVQSVAQSLLGGDQRGTPGAITPPVPVRSLVLAFFFVVPLNVVIQAYGSGLMIERLNRRGEALLVAPVSRYEIIAGKTLPYLVASIVISVLIAVAIGGGVVSIVAVLPLALLFLSATFVAAMVARSYRELSFLTVAVSVCVTTYAFVPALFTELAPVAAISPLSLVVWDLAGESVAIQTAVFAVVPPTLVAGILFLGGMGLFREEALFGQKPIAGKLLDAFGDRVARRGRVFLWSAAFVPFAFLAELLAIALLFAVQAPVTVPILLGIVAVVEEGVKSVHVRAGFQRGSLPSTDRMALVSGVHSGLGFALAEKLVVAVQFVGLSELALAQAAFAPVGITDPLLLGGLLAAPFVMHVVTAVTTAVGARRSRPVYFACYGAAVTLHFAYDILVVVAIA